MLAQHGLAKSSHQSVTTKCVRLSFLQLGSSVSAWPPDCSAGCSTLAAETGWIVGEATNTNTIRNTEYQHQQD